MKPTWSTYVQIPSVVLSRVNLTRTIPTALITGLVLFAINQLDVVLRGSVSVAVWVKSGLCFVVPFCVSNLGVLLASRTEAVKPGTGIEPTNHRTGLDPEGEK